jgi:hypothetical protein
MRGFSPKISIFRGVQGHIDKRILQGKDAARFRNADRCSTRS